VTRRRFQSEVISLTCGLCVYCLFEDNVSSVVGGDANNREKNCRSFGEEITDADDSLSAPTAASSTSSALSPVAVTRVNKPAASVSSVGIGCNSSSSNS
jgi:hypothetical protein